ncbi:MAG: DUF4276 family protein [Vicinamibacterales bacterium]
MKVLLEGLLPKLYPGLPFICIPHEGKRDLETSLGRKLRAWREPGVRFCVLRDNDGGDCRATKQGVLTLCEAGGRPDTIVRIVCQELEAWYFGDLAAVAKAYGKPNVVAVSGRAKFRDPDAIAKPSRELAGLVEEFQKVSGARLLGPELSRENRSASFRVFIEAVDRLASEVSPS